MYRILRENLSWVQRYLITKIKHEYPPRSNFILLELDLTSQQIAFELKNVDLTEHKIGGKKSLNAIKGRYKFR